MRKVAALLSLACALCVGVSSSEGARAMARFAGTCGIPAASPLWIDFADGSVPFWSMFAKKGVVAAASNLIYPPQLRAGGASTVYFDLHLVNRIGQPSAPVDPSLIAPRANKFFDYTSESMGCSTPTIVENELFGANLPTPWSQTNQRYRDNVMAFLQALAARGAHPVLLINSDPYTGSPEAIEWWRNLSQIADIVREMYVPATITQRLGPRVGSRNLRQQYRSAITDFTSVGIDPSRLGVMVSFSTTVGFGGRNGLQPREDWFEIVKLQSLALTQVAAETGVGTLWSWGWATWTDPEKDADKPDAACVWLWTRNPSLCDGPSAAGPDFNTSRTEGRVALGTDVQCRVGKRGISNDAIQRVQLMTGDRDSAFTAVYERLVESAEISVSARRVLAAEREVIEQHFHGDGDAYRAALARAHASVGVARGILGDELRRAALLARIRTAAPSGSDVSAFYTAYPQMQVRPVTATPAPAWLGGRKRGLALGALAPGSVFSAPTGRRLGVVSASGAATVRTLGATVPLGSLPLSSVRGAISDALRHFARADGFDRWTQAQQAKALDDAVCARDDMPQPGSVDLSEFLPFLRLGA